MPSSATASANGRTPVGSAPGPAPSPHFTCERITSDRRLRFNPIRHLSPESLARALDAFHLGYLRPAALLWDAMERRDDVLQGVAAKRKKSVARLDGEILADDASPVAQQHQRALEFFYGNLTATHACEPNQRGAWRCSSSRCSMHWAKNTPSTKLSGSVARRRRTFRARMIPLPTRN